MSHKFRWIMAVLLPIAILGSLVARNEWLYRHAEEVVLPISGYDPRDILAGHYLTYQVEYGVPTPCQSNSRRSQGTLYMCLKPAKVIRDPRDLENCSLYIRGHCQWNRFVAGIERYYVPEAEAENLDKLIRKGQVKLVVRVSPNGHARAARLVVEESPRQ